MSKKISDKLRYYHFEVKHLLVVFIVLLAFQLVLSMVNKSSITRLLGRTQEWYQKDSAENLANLTTTSLELLLESISGKEHMSNEELKNIIQSFDIVFSQQKLQNNIGELCIIVERNGHTYAIDDGTNFFTLFLEHREIAPAQRKYDSTIALYRQVKNTLIEKEQIKSIITEKRTFHTFVPLVLRGEYIGALYIRNTPDFSVITDQIIYSYDETSLIYMSLILLGLLAMFFISSYTVKERNEAQKMLLQEYESNLEKQINHEKEMTFTKRIYHTHHKAEKIMGFIKDDLRQLSQHNTEEIKYRVTRYSNFISRVIYDMKWFDPPVQTIRNQIFRTNLNEVINFIVQNIFLRISYQSQAFEIKMDLEENLPVLQINEFVLWEIIEPLIQNCIEHSGVDFVTIKICSKYDCDNRKIVLSIEDNGKGVAPGLLETDDSKALKKIFLEHSSTKQSGIKNNGYGCYIAYVMSKRCGWELDAENIATGGCRFVISINQ
ncbi:MAG: ATP-binding protein [Bacteroidota bacterium]